MAGDFVFLAFQSSTSERDVYHRFHFMARKISPLCPSEVYQYRIDSRVRILEMKLQFGNLSLLICITVLTSCQAFLFDCEFPFQNCGNDGSSSNNNESPSVTVSYPQNQTYTYTYTYTRWFTSQLRNQDTDRTQSQPTIFAENLNISSVETAISVINELDSLGLSKNESVKAVNMAISAVAATLNQSQPSNLSTQNLISLFDQAVKYVELMNSNETKNFLQISSNVLMDSFNASGGETERKSIVVKLEEYAIAAAANVLESSGINVVSWDLGTVQVTFCKSGTGECLLESENVEFESIEEENLLVTFIEHKTLASNSITVDSIITSASAQDLSRNKVSVPVTFTLKHNQVLGSDHSSSCVFLNVTTAKWSSDGCQSIFVNSTHTKCFCNHTTNFAILFLHSSIGLTEADEFWFNLMTYIGCGVSITSLIATMTIFIVLRLHHAERVIILWNLCFCLCSAQLILVAGTSAQVGTVGCKVIAILLHFFFTASFSWMLMEGIHLYMKASNARGGRYKFKLVLVSGWALPICIISISVGVGLDQYGSGNACWLAISNGFIWAFIGPAMAIIAANTIVLIFVIKVFLGLKSISKTSERERIKKATKAVLFLMPLLGITWIFGFLAFDESTKWFLYLFCICNSLQGLAIFILQCAKNDDVRKAFFKKYRRTFVSIGSYTSGASGSSNKTNDSYMTSDHLTKGLPTIAKW